MNDFYESYKDKIDKNENKKSNPEFKGDIVNSESVIPSKFVKPDSEPIVVENKSFSRNKQNIIKIATFIVFLIVFLLLIFRFTTRVEVPDFSDWNKTDAVIWASQNGITIKSEDIYYDLEPNNQIISQKTEAGKSIKKGSVVFIEVSKGHDYNVRVEVPDFNEMTKTEIELWATENYMTTVRFITEYNDTIEKGKIINIDIEDPDYIDTTKRSTPIYITISKGKEDISKREVLVPDFKVMAMTDILEFAKINFLTITFVEEYNDYLPKGMIISQDTEVDSIVNPGDSIELTISLGEKITMPSLSGLSKEQAMIEISKLGLTVTFKEKYSTASSGTLIYQSVKYGATVDENTKLTLTYSLGSQIRLDSFVGMKLINLEAFVATHNAMGAKLKISKTKTQSNQQSGIILTHSKTDSFIGHDAEISVVVSSGETVIVPDFVAITNATYSEAINRQKAQMLADSVGIIIIFVESQNNSRLEGEVWEQNISAGMEVKKGSTITLKYNKVASTLNIADFSGLTLAEVRAHQDYFNLNVEIIVGESTAGYGSGEIYKQSINVGTTVQFGTELTLTISP